MQYISQKYLLQTPQSMTLTENGLLCKDKADKFLMNYSTILFIKLCTYRKNFGWNWRKRTYYCEIYNTDNQCITIYETFQDYPNSTYKDFIKALHLHCKHPNLNCEYHSDQPRISYWLWCLLFIACLFINSLWFTPNNQRIFLWVLIGMWFLSAVFFVRGVKQYNPTQIPDFMFY